jgi:hypothetical protein
MKKQDAQETVQKRETAPKKAQARLETAQKELRLHEEAVRLISETPGADNLADVLRLRGPEVFSSELREMLTRPLFG